MVFHRIKKTLTFCSLFITFCSLDCFSQEYNCGTPEPTPAEHEYIVNSVRSSSKQKNSGTTCVPIRAFVVNDASGAGGVSSLDLAKMLANMNLYYLAAGIEFYFAYETSYINDADYYVYDQTSPDSDTETGLVGKFTTANDAINIYFVNSIKTASGFNAGGYAYYPSNNVVANRIVMTHGATRSGTTIIHELGHFFSLYHTFRGTQYGNNNADAEHVPRTGANSNCSTDGDLFCDTDADPYPSGTVSNCVYSGIDTDIHGNAYTPLTAITNIMSYYLQCSDVLTPQQYVAVGQGLTARLGHTAYSLNASPMTVSTPTNLAATASGDTIKLSWTDNASNEMGYLIERSSTSATAGFKMIENGAVGPNATSFFDLDISSNTTYYYRIKASNGNCNTYSNVSTLKTGLVYCTPSVAASNNCAAATDPSGATVAFGINRFRLSNSSTSIIDNNNSGCSGSGYSNYTAISGTISPGITYDVSVTVNINANGYLFNQFVSAWLDMDQDGTFSSSELLYQSTTGSSAASFSFTIPSGTPNGSTRLRVRSSSSLVTDPCGSTTFGETEDYSVTICEDMGATTNSNSCETYTKAITAGAGWTSITDASGKPLAAINAPTGVNLGTVTLRTMSASTVGTTSSSSSSTVKLLPRYFQLSASNYSSGGTFPDEVGVILYFTNSDLTALNNSTLGSNGASTHTASQLNLTHYNGTNQDCSFGNNVYSNTNTELLSSSVYRSVGCGSSTNHSLEFTVGHFSEFILHEPSTNPLPVELMSFDAKQTDNKSVSLNWATASEINNKGFDIEHSIDGRTWEFIHFQTGANNSQTWLNYHWNHNDPIFGQNFYRLKQLDFDGQYQYSNVALVNIKDQENLEEVIVYPNPVLDNQLTIYIPSSYTSSGIKVYDNKGHL